MQPNVGPADPTQDALAGVFEHLKQMGSPYPGPGSTEPFSKERRDPFVKPPESIALEAALQPEQPAAPDQPFPTAPETLDASGPVPLPGGAAPPGTDLGFEGRVDPELHQKILELNKLLPEGAKFVINFPKDGQTAASPELGPGGAAPEVINPNAEREAARKAEIEDDARVESELSKYFDVNVEDIVPKDLLDELKKQAKGGMELHDAIGIAGIAITNPGLAGQLLMDIRQRRTTATGQLTNLASQVGSFRKEGGRQLAMYMRARADQRARQSDLDQKASDKEYLERSKQSAAFLSELRKAGLDPDVAGVPPISEEILRNPVAFGDWVQTATAAASKGQGKQQFLAELSGMKANGPATLAAKTGADPTAAVSALALQHGFTPEEIAGLQPTIKTFAEVAKQASAGIDQDRLRAQASMQWMQSMADKNKAQMGIITGEIQGNPMMKREKAVSLMNSTMLLNMTAQAEFTNVRDQLALEMQKKPLAEADTGGFFDFNNDKPGNIQDPARIEALQRRLESASMLIAESNQALSMLQPIVQGTGAGDVSAMLLDIGPKLAESSRVATLGGKIKPPGVPPPVIAEAMAAAADPATWLNYLKQPPIGPDGQPNMYRTAFWASVVRQMGAALGGLQDPEDILRLLDGQSAGQPSYVDMFAGQDITLPAQPISSMVNSLAAGPAGAAGAPPTEGAQQP